MSTNTKLQDPRFICDVKSSKLKPKNDLNENLDEIYRFQSLKSQSKRDINSLNELNTVYLNHNKLIQFLTSNGSIDTKIVYHYNLPKKPPPVVLKTTNNFSRPSSGVSTYQIGDLVLRNRQEEEEVNLKNLNKTSMNLESTRKLQSSSSYKFHLSVDDMTIKGLKTDEQIHLKKSANSWYLVLKFFSKAFCIS